MRQLCEPIPTQSPRAEPAWVHDVALLLPRDRIIRALVRPQADAAAAKQSADIIPYCVAVHSVYHQHSAIALAQAIPPPELGDALGHGIEVHGAKVLHVIHEHVLVGHAEGPPRRLLVVHGQGPVEAEGLGAQVDREVASRRDLLVLGAVLRVVAAQHQQPRLRLAEATQRLHHQVEGQVLQRVAAVDQLVAWRNLRAGRQAW